MKRLRRDAGHSGAIERAAAVAALAVLASALSVTGVQGRPRPRPTPTPTVAPTPSPSPSPEASVEPAQFATPAAVATALGDAGEKARFSAALAYTGAPNLPATSSLVAAGGGPNAFSAAAAIEAIGGDKTQSEVGNLRARFGADGVKSFVNVFTFAVDDAVRRLAAAQTQLPKPSPAPSDGKALAAALYKLGVTPSGAFDVEYMLDALLSHEVHVQVMNDIDARYGQAADANYHAVLSQAISDLRGG